MCHLFYRALLRLSIVLLSLSQVVYAQTVSAPLTFTLPTSSKNSGLPAGINVTACTPPTTSTSTSGTTVNVNCQYSGSGTITGSFQQPAGTNGCTIVQSNGSYSASCTQQIYSCLCNGIPLPNFPGYVNSQGCGNGGMGGNRGQTASNVSASAYQKSYASSQTGWICSTNGSMPSLSPLMYQCTCKGVYGNPSYGCGNGGMGANYGKTYNVGSNQFGSYPGMAPGNNSTTGWSCTPY